MSTRKKTARTKKTNTTKEPYEGFRVTVTAGLGDAFQQHGVNDPIEAISAVVARDHTERGEVDKVTIAAYGISSPEQPDFLIGIWPEMRLIKAALISEVGSTYKLLFERTAGSA